MFQRDINKYRVFFVVLNWSQQTSELHLASMQSDRFYVVTLHDTELRFTLIKNPEAVFSEYWKIKSQRNWEFGMLFERFLNNLYSVCFLLP